MNRLVINSQGFGGTASDEASQCVALGYASYLTNPWCWGQSYQDWQNQFYGTTPGTGVNTINPPAPIPPSAPSNLTSLPDTTGAAAQALSDAAIAATQAATAAANPPTADACQQFSNNWPYPIGNMDCPTMMLWGAGILAAILILPRLMK